MVNFGAIGAGMAGGAVVSIVIKATDEFSKTFDSATKSMSGLEGIGGKLTSGLFGVTGAVAGLTGTLATFAFRAAEAGDVQESFNKIVGEESTKVLKDLQKVTLGTINKVDLMKIATKGFNAGLKGETLTTVADFAQRIKDAGITTQSVGEIISDVTQAMATGRFASLKPLLGGAEIENSSDLLGAIQERLTALPEPSVDAADKLAQFQTKMDDLATDIGAKFLPQMEKFIDKAMPLFDKLSGEVLDNVVPALVDLFGVFTDIFARLSDEGILEEAISAIGLLAVVAAKAVTIIAKGLETFLGLNQAMREWSKIVFDKVVLAFQTVGLGFDLMKNTMQLGLAGIQKIVAETANFIIGTFEKAINKVIGLVNNLIDRFNSLPALLRGGLKIGKLGGVSLDNFKIDTAAIDANIGNLLNQQAAIGKQININIENLTGIDSEQIARQLRLTLNDVVSS